MIRRCATFTLILAATTRGAVGDCTFSGSIKNGTAAVIDAGNSLQSDGLGMYVTEREKYMQVNAQAAWNIFPFRGIVRNVVPSATAQRHLMVDLNNPAPNGGGVPRGIIKSWAGPHSYWRLDADKRVHSVLDIAEGATEYSDLTAIFISTDDGAISYLLQMGPWSWQTCENHGPVETAGSTRVIMTRTGAKTWTVRAPAGSVGVLHDVRDPQKPVPLGLYYISFEIHYRLE